MDFTFSFGSIQSKLSIVANDDNLDGWKEESHSWRMICFNRFRKTNMKTISIKNINK